MSVVSNFILYWWTLGALVVMRKMNPDLNYYFTLYLRSEIRYKTKTSIMRKVIDFVRNELKPKVDQAKAKEKSKPLIVSIMGETGVGKSSLINALFGTELEVSSVRPSTKAPTPISVLSEDKEHELIFYDLPGAGESNELDKVYLEMYVKLALKSDVVIWAMHIDSRSVSYNKQFLRNLIFELQESKRINFFNKIVFILTKADLLHDGKWIYDSESNIFAPNEEKRKLLKEKSEYFKEHFILGFSEFLKTSVPNSCRLRLQYPKESYLEIKNNLVYCTKVLNNEDLNYLKNKYEKCSNIFDSLLGSQEVICVSSFFKFNLLKVLMVVVNKQKGGAIFRIENFINSDELDKVSKEEVSSFSQIKII